MAIDYYRNIATGELESPHRIGETDDGEQIYIRADGYEPVYRNEAGEIVEAEYWCDEDGNWISDEPSQGYPEEWTKPINL